jgi:cell division protein FtsW (lipid II flippase)
LDNKFVENIDWVLVVTTLVLIGVGLLNLYSIGHVPEDLRESFVSNESHFFQRQAVWALLGIVVLILAAIIPFKYYELCGVGVVVDCFAS